MSRNKSFELKGELFTLTVFHLRSIDLKQVEVDLTERLAANPQFFKQIPVIVDLSAIGSGNNLDFNWLKNLLISKEIIPVALRGVTSEMEARAIKADWAILPEGMVGHSGETKKTESSDVTTLPQNGVDGSDPQSEHLKSSIVKTQVRSGQQVHIEEGDLIVINSVNVGAELLADGNIHVYGALRGRALAGIHGNEDARIFCQSLEAELISIAGRYKMLEEIPEEWRGKAVQIYLENDEFKIEQFIK